MTLRIRCFVLFLAVITPGLSNLSAQPSIRAGEAFHRVKSGDTLESIVRQRYGNRCYMGLIAAHNGLVDSRLLVVGDTLRLPDLAVILAQEGLTPLVGAEMKSILAARETYAGVQLELWTIRRNALRIAGDPGTPRPTLDLPEHVVASIVAASGQLRSAARGLRQPREGIINPPHHLIGQLEKAAENLDPQSQGIQDGYGYDIDMIHQRIALALKYAIIWAEEGFR